jgi:gamma-glutamyltranspeptidase/glutathione hydrolase
MYGGPWGQKLVAAVQADGGFMTLDDLTSYEVLWAEPLVAAFGDYEVYTNPWPNAGGVAMIEALNLARAAGLPDRDHWSVSGKTLRDALNVSMASHLWTWPPEQASRHFPGIDFSPESRVTPEHAEKLWTRISGGAARWVPRRKPGHSDNVVAIDAEGNIAALTQSINCVFWGKTAIFVDGISIGDPASSQQTQIARTGPGERLPGGTEAGDPVQERRSGDSRSVRSGVPRGWGR